MKILKWILIFICFTIVLAGCERSKTVCTPEAGASKHRPALVDLIALPAPQNELEDSIAVEIGNKRIEVDKFVDYSLCNDNWSGTVYVSCEAVVADSELDAEENPLFFKGCNLNIESGTIVYVAAHNDAAYYKGCSCHTGEDPIP